MTDLDLHGSDDPLLDHYRTAAAGAQKLAECIDTLLPALIEIAASKGATVQQLKKLADSALLNFEEKRGQALNRRKYMASTEQAAATAVAEARHVAAG